jgi:hypothetical protein
VDQEYPRDKVAVKCECVTRNSPRAWCFFGPLAGLQNLRRAGGGGGRAWPSPDIQARFPSAAETIKLPNVAFDNTTSHSVPAPPTHPLQHPQPVCLLAATVPVAETDLRQRVHHPRRIRCSLLSSILSLHWYTRLLMNRQHS